jgi:fermentation-respiration switch protein FrsA (DUF1100 family)
MIATTKSAMIWNIIFSPLALLGGLYCLLALSMYIFQDRLLYFPNQPSRDYVKVPTDVGLEYEEVRISTTDSVVLGGWFIPADKARGVVLFFHGNAGNISHRLDSIRIFNALGLDVLIFDYRGYGQSTGTPSEPGTYLDSEAAWRYLVDKRRYSPQRIILFGRSLGGAVGVHLANEQNPAALIVESTFSSVPDLAAELYPWLPVRSMSRFQYNSRQKIQSVTCPILVVHSPQDEIIPITHGRRIYSAAPEPKDFLEISGNHNNGFLISGASYTTGLDHFLSIHLH